jgi:hypothetical protein
VTSGSISEDLAAWRMECSSGDILVGLSWLCVGVLHCGRAMWVWMVQGKALANIQSVE